MDDKLKKFLENSDFSEQMKWVLPQRPFFAGVNLDYYTKMRLLGHYQKDVATFITIKKDFIKDGKSIIKELLSGKSDHYIFFKNSLQELKEYIARYMPLPEDSGYEMSEDINRRHSEFMEVFFSFDFAMSDWAEDLKTENHDLAEKFMAAINPVEKSFINIENGELKKIFQKTNIRNFSDFKKDKKFKNKLLAHAEKWKYFQNNYNGAHREKLEDLFMRGVNALDNKTKGISDEEIEKRLSALPEKYRLLAKAVSVVFNVKDERKRLCLIGVEIFQDYLNAVAAKLKVPADELAWLTFREVRDLELGKAKYKNPWIKNKERFIAYFNGRTEDIPRKTFNDIFKKKGREAASLNEFRGIIANKGIKRGKIKICLSRNDFAKVKNGDVIVASMTRPDFLPIMERASAFITDEGGITCHAAIIAREMDKPCIIGTKIATKVLKDGNLVEVDAENGIVRILKK